MVNNLRVVIAAAGIGSRMNSKVNKQYIPLKGRPVIAYSLDTFEKIQQVDSIVIVANSNELDYCKNEIVKKYGYQKVTGVIPGGKQRQASVRAGLNYISGSTDFVAVHDGARPLVTSQLVQDLLTEAEKWGAAIPGVLARETLKTVDGDGMVVDTLDRSRIVVVQTPQIFKYDMLLEAYEKAYTEGVSGTDDASIFEKYMGRVRVVNSDNRNMKITTPEDIAVAESLMDFKTIL